uniref:Insulin-like domain-containing protein n=1 Tax=Malurus cyaneus samueli TaxID=2593467 RepID=A0A8C5T3B2_9PASS
MRSTAVALACLVLLLLAQEGKGEGNTVRLCGRDFIRAVVFTCGGSRWRRHLTGDADFSSHTEQGLGIHSEEPQDVKPEQDLQNSSKVSVLNKREAAKLLTTSCCNVGCSRREISSLC